MFLIPFLGILDLDLLLFRACWVLLFCVSVLKVQSFLNYGIVNYKECRQRDSDKDSGVFIFLQFGSMATVWVCFLIVHMEDDGNYIVYYISCGIWKTKISNLM